jgi:predicted Holliday junction resolvase-like endonuclease
MECEMATTVSEIFSQFSHVFGICPCCGEPFRVSDARPYIKDRRPHSAFDDIEAEEQRIERAVELLEEQEMQLRAKAKVAGLKQAKSRLRKIDPVFSGERIDPHDVKVIFDPIEYIVFDGMKGGQLRKILLLGHPPVSRARERLLTSIEQTIQKGNITFKTLRILEDGGLHLT